MPDKNCPVNSGHAIETALNFLEEVDPETAERALTLLEESDPPLVETLRGGLKNRSEPINLLRLHPSFWRREKGFATWQLLRRTAYYRDWFREFQWEDTAKFFDGSPVARYFRCYPPLSPREHYTSWSHRVRREARPDLTALQNCGRSLHLLPGFLPQPPKDSRIPDNWPPIPSEITFPHPNVLDKLTPSTLAVPVIVVPRRDKKKEPFKGLTPLKIGEKYFGVDLDHSDDDIYKGILSEFPSASSKSAQTKLIASVKDQLEQFRKDSVRDRRTKDGLPMIAEVLTTWDLYNIERLVAFDAIGMIAQELWPTEYPEKEKALRQRVRSYLEYAQKEIDALIPSVTP